MATLASAEIDLLARERLFFFMMSLLLIASALLGFGYFQYAGISSWGAPWWVHVHAFSQMGWLGFYALQIGLPERDYLSQSRIPSRFTLDYDPPAQVIADPHWLPFPENAIDLIVMPHALEFTDDPHLMLREAYRVIRPEGQIVISGFNPFSLFGMRRYFGRGATPPWNGNFIALYRLKDWLSLLGFDVVGGRFDCYVPPFTQEKWLRRFSFFEKAGDRWWPITGGVYYLRATKKVLGMRLLEPAWERRERRKEALAPAARAREGLTTMHLTAGDDARDKLAATPHS